MLGELWRLVVDVGHAYPHRGGAGAGDLPFVHGHDHKLIEVVGPFIVQSARRENGPMRRDGEVWTQRVIGQLGILPRVTVTGRHWERERGGEEKRENNMAEEDLDLMSSTGVPGGTACLERITEWESEESERVGREGKRGAGGE